MMIIIIMGSIQSYLGIKNHLSRSVRLPIYEESFLGWETYSVNANFISISVNYSHLWRSVRLTQSARLRLATYFVYTNFISISFNYSYLWADVVSRSPSAGPASGSFRSSAWTEATASRVGTERRRMLHLTTRRWSCEWIAWDSGVAWRSVAWRGVASKVAWDSGTREGGSWGACLWRWKRVGGRKGKCVCESVCVEQIDWWRRKKRKYPSFEAYPGESWIYISQP